MSTRPVEHETEIINCLRFLAVDAVEKANSGHPGMPMGAAPMAFTLWDQFMRHDPQAPHWPNRDRFVLSNGHGSMLLYGLLHIFGYDLPLDELKNFRQWGSKTPGHPEYGHTPGIETTTGPLGQGFANAVGMAMAEQMLAARFNKPRHDIVDHYTYAMVGDGCLMEGISHEAASLAGHLGLGKLIVLYDDNSISIDGPTELAFTENVIARFEAYGWHTSRVEDGNDTALIAEAITIAQDEKTKPSLIAVRTHIGFGAPNKQDSADAHGAPLGEEEVKLTKEHIGWPLKPTFHIPESVKGFTELARLRGNKYSSAWHKDFEAYKVQFPTDARAFTDAIESHLPDDWRDKLPAFSDAMATRKASGKVINAIESTLPQLVGGSADLAPSNNTLIASSSDFTRGNRKGRNIRFGVREHAMGAIVNGMALHRGLIPYGATFLVFSDYMRPAIRLSALMGIPSIFIFTHDSIGLGEDGPTHQPIEHLAALRVIPNLIVLRPADANETVGAWRVALESKDKPVCLVLTRQSLPLIEKPADEVIDAVRYGAYALIDPDVTPDLVLIATGSEVQIALKAAGQLKDSGRIAKVVSMPSWELFAAQPEAYKKKLLPETVPVFSVEAQTTIGWERWTKDAERCIGIDRFGASAPGKILMEKFGFTPENIAKRILDVL